jgi:hypothetical protein
MKRIFLLQDAEGLNLSEKEFCTEHEAYEFAIANGLHMDKKKQCFIVHTLLVVK